MWDTVCFAGKIIFHPFFRRHGVEASAILKRRPVKRVGPDHSCGALQLGIPRGYGTVGS